MSCYLVRHTTFPHSHSTCRATCHSFTELFAPFYRLSRLASTLQHILNPKANAKHLSCYIQNLCTVFWHLRGLRRFRWLVRTSAWFGLNPASFLLIYLLIKEKNQWPLNCPLLAGIGQMYRAENVSSFWALSFSQVSECTTFHLYESLRLLRHTNVTTALL